MSQIKMQSVLARWARLLRFFPLIFLLCPPVWAGANSLGESADVALQPLQELIRKKRVRGVLYVTIPQARVFGDDVLYQPYCSPQIRAINSSYKTVEELVAGIRYWGRGGKEVGTTVTRFHLVKVGKQETHYFYSSVGINYCRGLTGELEIIRCVYDNGDDCTADVRTVNYGAVPLRIKGKKGE